MSEPEHPAIAFNKWFETAASGEPFFPGLYTTEQLRAVCYLAWMAGGIQLMRERGETNRPISLTDAQELAVKAWAADDRLWTTQETVEFNLRTFARTILI